MSSLYSLADFQEDDVAKNYVENYLLGQYGAIPSIKPLMQDEN